MQRRRIVFIASGMVFLFLASRVQARYISYPDELEAASEDGRLLVRYQSDYDAGSELRLLNREEDTVAWEGRREIENVKELFLANGGYLVARSDWEDDYYLFSPRGEMTRLPHPLDSFSASEREDYSVGFHWRCFSREGFISFRGKEYFYISLYWGPILVIDLDGAAGNEDPEIRKHVADRLAEQAREVIENFDGNYLQLCEHCRSGDHYVLRPELRDNIFIINNYRLSGREKIVQGFIKAAEKIGDYRYGQYLERLENINRGRLLTAGYVRNIQSSFRDILLSNVSAYAVIALAVAAGMGIAFFPIGFVLLVVPRSGVLRRRAFSLLLLLPAALGALVTRKIWILDLSALIFTVASVITVIFIFFYLRGKSIRGRTVTGILAGLWVLVFALVEFSRSAAGLFYWLLHWVSRPHWEYARICQEGLSGIIWPGIIGAAVIFLLVPIRFSSGGRRALNRIIGVILLLVFSGWLYFLQMPEIKVGYRRGRAAARRDLEAEIYRLKAYGEQPESRKNARWLLVNEYGVELEFKDEDYLPILVPEQRRYYDGYNEVQEEALEERFGEGFLLEIIRRSRTEW